MVSIRKYFLKKIVKPFCFLKNCFLRTVFVSYFFVIVTVIVTVIVPYAMFILLLWTEIEDKHCQYHYACDYDCDCDKKIRYNAPP